MRDAREVWDATSNGSTDASSPASFGELNWIRHDRVHHSTYFTKSLGMAFKACRRWLRTRCSLFCLRGTNAQKYAWAYHCARTKIFLKHTRSFSRTKESVDKKVLLS